MKDRFTKKIGAFLTEQKSHGRRTILFLCLSAVVLYGTVTALKLYGQALNYKRDVLECGFEIHSHSDSCYDGGDLICGYADYAIHTHNDLCYDWNGKLACQLPEHEAHQHSDGCYETVRELDCDIEYDIVEAAAEPEGSVSSGDAASSSDAERTERVLTCDVSEHTHDDSCYSEGASCSQDEHVHDSSCMSETLVCPESEHSHEDSCYDSETGELTCALSEHVHEGGCYAAENTCGMSEHTHDDSCSGKRELTCGMSEHMHDDSCYDEVTVDPGDSDTGTDGTDDAPGTTEVPHEHTDDCYIEHDVLTCGEYELHEHTDSCFSDGAWSCGQPELLEHVHTVDSCIVEKTLSPEEIEDLDDGSHHHDSSCYDENGDLACGYDADHAHKPGCYYADGNLICGYGTLKHVHVDSCYDENGELICGYDADSHRHSEDCYDADGNLICGYESETHLHDESCYDADGNLICGYESEKHLHDESCYDADGNLICGYEAEAHLHEKGCYDENGKLVCGYASLYHPHTKDCYDAEGNLICGYEAEKHVHEFDCYDDDGNLICGYDGLEHEHDESCYDEAGNLICGFDESGERIIPIYCLEYIHSHNKTCYGADGVLSCGKADYAIHEHTMACRDLDNKLVCPVPEREGDIHEHDDSCYTDSELICGMLEVLEHVHDVNCTRPGEDIVRVFDGDGFTVEAAYSTQARIPKDAEFICELVDDDPEDVSSHYKKRLDEYRAAVDDKFANMRALMKIGFYLDGKEIEPEAPVRISVQFYDENGEPEGRELTAVHFLESGADVLEGDSLDGKTVFEMSHFSEIALGYGAENVTVALDEEIFYDAGDLKITFYIKGDAAVPIADNADDADAAGGEAESDMDDAGTDLHGDLVQATPIENEDLDGLEFRVGPAGEDSPTWSAAKAYAESVEGTSDVMDENGPLVLAAWDFAVVYGDSDVDLSECEVRANIKPSKKLASEAAAAKEASEEGTENAEPYRLDAFAIVDGGLAGEAGSVALDGGVEPGADASDDNENTEDEDDAGVGDGTDVDLGGSSGLGGMVSGQPNPHFTVSYYARLDRVKGEESGSMLTHVKIIDTSKTANGTDGPVLPSNGSQPMIRWVNTENGGRLLTENTLTRVYHTKNFEYHRAPTINYMDILVENPFYDIVEVWVRKDGASQQDGAGADEAVTGGSDINPDEWDKYNVADGIHFTNRSVSADDGKYIFIRDGAEIMFVYDPTHNDKSSFNAAFYDYDISSGVVYHTDLDEVEDFGTLESHPTGDIYGDDGNPVEPYKTWLHDGHLWIDTIRKGINSDVNYSGDGARFGFGNAFGPYGLETLDGNKFNQSGSGFDGCTFGLVKGITATDGTGLPIYADGLSVPSLFGGSGATGKTCIDGWQLGFKRDGDTYTMTSVSNGSSDVLSGLDTLSYAKDAWHPSDKPVTKVIYSNEFWPMDHAHTFGGYSHDFRLGRSDTETAKIMVPDAEKGWIQRKFYSSDHGVDHNNFFGMNYAVSFDLVDDYDGPLEYYFFGDDDMWVFLDGQLVCDIGGVHGAVGEYVDLWDYLHRHTDECFDEENNVICGNDNNKTHVLSFFYTERGASGSTCWMQFTLPSVSVLTPETSDKEYGQLKVTKTVAGVTGDGEITGTGIPNNDEFEFTIHLTDTEGNNLPDDYSYVKYDADGSEIGYDLIIWDGGTFKLKDGQSVVIKYLPAGTRYVIEETGHTGTVDFVTDIRNNDSYTANYDGLDPDYEPDLENGAAACQDLDEGDRVAEGTIVMGQEAQVEYRNKFYVYGLPATGGSGIAVYAFAGALAIMAVLACFTYKRRRTGR